MQVSILQDCDRWSSRERQPIKSLTSPYDKMAFFNPSNISDNLALTITSVFNQISIGELSYWSRIYLRICILIIVIFLAFKKEQKEKESKKKEAAEKRKQNQEETETENNKKLKADEKESTEIVDREESKEL